jgi:hypothetical protein
VRLARVEIDDSPGANRVLARHGVSARLDAAATTHRRARWGRWARPVDRALRSLNPWHFPTDIGRVVLVVAIEAPTARWHISPRPTKGSTSCAPRRSWRGERPPPPPRQSQPRAGCRQTDGKGKEEVSPKRDLKSHPARASSDQPSHGHGAPTLIRSFSFLVSPQGRNARSGSSRLGRRRLHGRPDESQHTPRRTT